MALTFDALGDGNCFYNSIMTRLAVDWLNGTLPRNEVTRTQLAGLFSEVAKFESSLNITAELSDSIEDTTYENIDRVFNIILEHCRIDSQTIDWVKYQKLMGPVAREFIIDKIENDESIREPIIAELTQAATYTLDISTVDNINYPAHFTGMPQIMQKLKATVMDVATDIDIRKIAVAEWFRGSDEEQISGFALWLRGQNGVALDTTIAGVLELKAFTKLFNISAQFRMPGDQQGVNQLVTGFGDIRPLRLGTKEAEPYTAASTYSLEYTGGHWKIYLADDIGNVNKSICETYVKQRKAHVKQLFIDNATLNLKDYKTYSSHAESLNVTKLEYCKMHKLTSYEYENNLLPGESLMPSIPPMEPEAPSLVNRSSVSAAAILLMAISAVVVMTAPIGIPSALFTLAFFAGVATLGLNAIDVISDYFFPELPEPQVEPALNSNKLKTTANSTVDAALNKTAEPIISSKINQAKEPKISENERSKKESAFKMQ